MFMRMRKESTTNYYLVCIIYLKREHKLLYQAHDLVNQGNEFVNRAHI